MSYTLHNPSITPFERVVIKAVLSTLILSRHVRIITPIIVVTDFYHQSLSTNEILLGEPRHRPVIEGLEMKSEYINDNPHRDRVYGIQVVIDHTYMYEVTDGHGLITFLRGFL